jgi:acetyl-CoA acetyltransferase family protein
MPEAVIVSAVRTPIAVAFKGTLRDTPAEDLAQLVVGEAISRSGVSPELVDDVILAESLYGGGDLARHAAVGLGLTRVPGQAVNRHCAGSLTAVGNAAAGIRSGMDRVIVAGGAMSTSMMPTMHWRVPGSAEPRIGIPPTYPFTEGPGDDVTITTGWAPALEAGLSRAEVDAWALRSHMRAVAAIDAGTFDAEIVTVKVPQADGSMVEFAVDEGPRRTTTLDKLAGLKPLHPEIDGFSVTAGNASGVNDAAAALTLVDAEIASIEGLSPLATVRAWGALGVDPARTGMGAVDVIAFILARAGLAVSDVTLWEINEAFASVPLAACRVHGIDEDRVNVFGSGCSLGHPVAASGARMLTTLTHELGRRSGGIGVAAMCAGGGQAGAVVIEVG